MVGNSRLFTHKPSKSEALIPTCSDRPAESVDMVSQTRFIMKDTGEVRHETSLFVVKGLHLCCAKSLLEFRVCVVRA